MKERALETASNVQQASGEAVVLDTTGTGIPTVETHDGDSWQALARDAINHGKDLLKVTTELDAKYDAALAELSRVQAQRDALAEACRMVVRRWDDARLDDSDMDALRAALSTGGGK